MTQSSRIIYGAPVAGMVGTFAVLAGNASAQQVYRLGEGDRIKVSVFGESNLSGEFEIADGGTIALPLIGEVVARGRSLREHESAITKKLADGYLKSP